MKRHRPPAAATRTAWHPLFVRNLRRSLPRLYFHVSAEWSLSQEPLRQDAVVVRKRHLPPNFVPTALPSLVPLLGEITLISLKGPQAVFDLSDYLHLWACAALFCRDEGVEDPAQVRLMAVAPRLSDRCQAQIARRGRQLVPTLTPGISLVTLDHPGRSPVAIDHQGRSAAVIDHALWIVETDVVADPLLRFFSQRSRPDVRAEALLLTNAEQAILRELMADVRQFNYNPRLRLKYPDLEQVAMSIEEFAESLQEFLPAEKRLKGLTTEERFKGLPPEELLKCVPPEERLTGLTDEECVKLVLARVQKNDGFTPEMSRQLSDLFKSRRQD